MKQSNKYLSSDCRYALKKILTRYLERFRRNFAQRRGQYGLHDDNIFNNTPGGSKWEREYSNE